MSNVIHITALIAVNKQLIASNREKARLEAELLSQGDKVHEGERYRVIVKDKKITVVPKMGPKMQIQTPPEDVIA